eukprot:jgi/Astpho2/9568/fgenesh1_pg.00146_%23_22_t
MQLMAELSGEQGSSADLLRRLEQAESKAAALEAKVQEAERGKRELTHLVGDMQRARKEAALAAQQTSALREKISMLTSDVDAAKADVTKAQKDVEAEKKLKLEANLMLKARLLSVCHAMMLQGLCEADHRTPSLQTLQGQYEAARQQLTSSHQEVQTCKAQLHQAQQSLLELKGKMLEAEQPLQQMVKRAQVAEAALCKSREEGEESRLTIMALRVELQSAQTGQDLLQSQLQAAHRELECCLDHIGEPLQAASYQQEAGVLKLDNKRAQEDTQRLQEQIWTIGERFENLLLERAEATSAVQTLRQELGHTRQRLQGDQQAALNEQARAAAERNALNERIHSLEGQLQQAQHRSAQLRAQHADLLAQADAAVQRAVLSKVLEDMGDCTGRWEAEVATAEQRVGALGDLLAMLAATMAAHHKRLDAAGSRDVAQMERQVADLLAQLQVEQRSHQLTREAMARQAPTYAAHIEAVRAQASEDAAAERRRLQSQLIHLEGEVHKLRELWQAEKQAKEGLLEVERIQTARQVDQLRSQNHELQHELQKALQRHQQATEAANAAHGLAVGELRREAGELGAALELGRLNVKNGLTIAEGLAGDVDAVDARLTEMGLYNKPYEASLKTDLAAGDAGALLRALSHIRMHFLYLAEKVQENVRVQKDAEEAESAAASTIVLQQAEAQRERRRVQTPGLHSLSQQELQLRSTVAKLVNTEETYEALLHRVPGPAGPALPKFALQALFSCLACVALLKRPVVCVPCGHCYCHACLMASERNGHLTCPECNHLPIQRWVPDRVLEGLLSKHEYKMQTLRDLQTSLNQRGDI